MTRPVGWLVMAGLVACAWFSPADAQSALGGAIAGIEVVGLSPFTLSFRVANEGPAHLGIITGRAILRDRLGQIVEVIPVESFSVPPTGERHVAVGSRWGFQRTGTYLLEVVLDLGPDALISSSIAFRILPIPLPLVPIPAHEDDTLMTVFQEPVNWGLRRIGAPNAWRLQHGSEDVVVAVIDAGIDTTIPQIEASLWINEDEVPDNRIDDDGNGYVDDVHGWDFRDHDASSLTGTSLHWHGTFIAGIIAARPGAQPIVGVAPGVRVMDVRFLDSENEFSTADWRRFSEAVEYAVNNGADIINLSVFAHDRPPRVFEATLEAAARRGVLIVGLSGNSGTEGVLYPGRYDWVQAVGATTEKDDWAGFSTHGAEVFVCAPGAHVVSFVPGGGTSTRSGTSFAAAHVSGTLALILSAHPGISAAQALDALRETALDLGPQGFDPYFGHGLIDAFAAVAR